MASKGAQLLKQIVTSSTGTNTFEKIFNKVCIISFYLFFASILLVSFYSPD